MLLEQHDIGGRQIVCDQHQVFFRVSGGRRHITGLARQCLHDALGDLNHVGAAFAQVAVLDGIKLLQQFVGLHFQRPLGVAMLGLDDVPGDARQRRVVEDHQVQVDEGRELRRRTCRNGAAQLLEFAAHGGHCKIKTHHFIGQLFQRHFIVRDFEFGVRNQMGAADGDAARDADAVDRKTHGCRGRKVLRLVTMKRILPFAGWPLNP